MNRTTKREKSSWQVKGKKNEEEKKKPKHKHDVVESRAHWYYMTAMSFRDGDISRERFPNLHAHSLLDLQLSRRAKTVLFHAILLQPTLESKRAKLMEQLTKLSKDALNGTIDRYSSLQPAQILL
jgi:hypothetical protein